MQNELTNKTMTVHESRDSKAAHRHKARKKAAKMEPFRKGFTAAVIPEDPGQSFTSTAPLDHIHHHLDSGLAAAVEINRSHWLDQSARRGTPAARPDNCVGPDSCVGL